MQRSPVQAPRTRALSAATVPLPRFPIEDAPDDLGWADANARWLTRRAPPPRRPRYERAKTPLVLCGHGVNLRVDKGTLHIRDGFTHYPQERQEYRFFKGDLALPRRIVMLDGSGSLSFDVLSWLSEQDVTLTRLSYQGEVTSVLAGSGSAVSKSRGSTLRATTRTGD